MFSSLSKQRTKNKYFVHSPHRRNVSYKTIETVKKTVNMYQTPNISQSSLTPKSKIQQYSTGWDGKEFKAQTTNQNSNKLHFAHYNPELDPQKVINFTSDPTNATFVCETNLMNQAKPQYARENNALTLPMPRLNPCWSAQVMILRYPEYQNYLFAKYNADWLGLETPKGKTIRLFDQGPQKNLRRNKWGGTDPTIYLGAENPNYRQIEPITPPDFELHEID